MLDRGKLNMLSTKTQAHHARPAAAAEPTRKQPQAPQVPALNPVWARLAMGIQAKLAVGAADDPLEAEADQVAERVMRMPQPRVQCTRAVSRPSGEDEQHAMRKPVASGESPAVEDGFVAALGLGQPLDPTVRAFFEPRFGQDFSRVRVHTGDAADRSAQAVNAVAYTVGQDIVFGAAQYAPQAPQGRRLLAHELTHVVQQRHAEPDSGADASGSPPVVGAARARRTLQRETISLRSAHRVTDVTPAPADNVREEVLALLDRLHTLWSIDNSGYDNQYPYIAALAAGAQVPQSDPAATPPWSLQPTMDAIRRNREPTLAAPVINHHLGGLAVSAGVGRGLSNNKADVLAVQDRLNFLTPYPTYATERAAVAALTAPAVPDAGLAGTFGAITAFKIGIASGAAGWATVRASESEFGGDRFAGQTASHTVTVLANHTASEGAAFETREPITVAIFLPAGLPPDRNKVFLFFSPGGGTETRPDRPGANATNVHAIRSGAESSEWIVIGIPGFRADTAERGWNTIDTAAIQSCLGRAGRGTRIDALRLSGHSRGGRGLTRTVARRLIDVGLIDRVIMLDQPHAGLAGSLSAGVPRGTRPAPIIDYTQGGGGAGTALNAQGVRAIGFARLVQDRPDLPPPAPAAALLAPILAVLPPRGSLTTHPVTAVSTSGRTNIHDWVRSHGTAVAAIASADGRAQTEWRRFVGAPTSTLDHTKVDPSPWFHVNTQNLMRFFSGPLIDASGRPVAFGFPLGIYAHHLFVAEIAEELFE